MKSDVPIHCDIVLVGGGHAHVDVLKKFGMWPEPGVRLSLISPASLTPYSGMLPGYLAGHYSLEETHVDLRPLCGFAGARFFRTAATGIDLEAGLVLCGDHAPIAFDFLSLDIGSAPTTAGIAGAEFAIPVKPVDRFLGRWREVEAGILAEGGDHHLAVIGAGAGGVEAALALNHRVRDALTMAGRAADGFRVSVIARSNVPMDTHGVATRRGMKHALDRNGIAFHGGVTVTAIEPGRLIGSPNFSLDVDTTILVTPGAAAPWLAGTGLPLDDGGFVRVGETLQSVGDPRVFGAGDTIAFEPRRLPKSGVYAVREGPVLADNLRRVATGREARSYSPQSRTLALVSMGRKRAVLSYGGLAAEGDWAWRFKDWIDRRWMRKYQDLPDMAAREGAGADPMRCGGCGAKVPADILRRVLARIARPEAVDGVLIGLDAPDDAAVLAPPADKLMVQTVDQFRAFVDDPYLFGRIAANHCLGDIYAMGATPSSALVAVTLPYADDAKIEADLELLLRGALVTFDEAGVALIGGHTGEGAETSLGFTVNGHVKKAALLRKGGLRRGNRLILTKPLGTGVLLAAGMRNLARGPWIDGAIETMLQSNRLAAEIVRRHGATAMTDVTGFGLAGHLAEMADASGAAVLLDPATVPILPGALEMFEAGVASSLQPGNRRAAAGAFGPDAANAPDILFDPQTAGGLLVGVSPGSVADCLEELRAAGMPDASEIGEVGSREGGDLISLV